MTNTILNLASSYDNWCSFLQYKIDKQHLSSHEENMIRNFIERKAYIDLCELCKQGKYPSQLPKKRIINKHGTNKKRIVYTFSGDEGIFLKFIAFHLFSFYSFFGDNCYTFRREYGV